MTKPKTKTGQPRKRAPGAGRPNAGRSGVLPRIKLGHKLNLYQLQTILSEREGKHVSLAETIEFAALAALDAVE